MITGIIIGAAALALGVAGVLVLRRRPAPIVIKVGDDVVTVGGLAGRVVRDDGDWLLLRLSRERGGVVATVLRSAVVGAWEQERRS